jgi:Lon protease-like protein
MFPGAFLPLHIFEARYREMTKAALEGQKLIGMILLQKGWEQDYEGAPPVFPVGCVCEIVQEESLPDGEYNIMLHGISRFHLQNEIGAASYRQGRIVLLESILLDSESDTLEDLRRKVLSYCVEILSEMQMENLLSYASSLAAEQLFDTAAFYLNMPVDKKQDMLTELHLIERGKQILSIVKERVALMRYLKQHKDRIPHFPMMN